MKLPSDLDIFSPSTMTQPLWTQCRAKARPSRHRLGPLVLVVREGEVDPAAVEVEALAEEVERHDHALGVPARAGPGPQGDSQVGSPGLGLLPQHEVERRALLLVGLDPGPGAQRVEALAGQQPVAVDAVDRQVDAVGGLVGDAPVHEVRRSARPCRVDVGGGVGGLGGPLDPSASMASHHAASYSAATSASVPTLRRRPGR